VVAFVDENYTEDSARALQGAVEEIENIGSVQFVTRGEAFDSFMENYSSDLAEGLDTQVLRDRFVIHLTDISRMSETKAAL
jgi:cell division protein FtsX